MISSLLRTRGDDGSNIEVPTIELGRKKNFVRNLSIKFNCIKVEYVIGNDAKFFAMIVKVNINLGQEVFFIFICIR